MKTDRIIQSAIVLLLLFILGSFVVASCDNGGSATEDAITCKANMKTVVTQSNVYASSHEGTYPANLDDLAGYLKSTHVTCPSGGTISWSFTAGQNGAPPDPSCSIHGRP